MMQIGSLIMRTGVTQALIQGIGLIGGILVVRLLPVEEYAVYTVMMALLGALTSLGDSGVAASVMAQAGRRFAEQRGFGDIISTGIACRRSVAWPAALLTLPAIVILLNHQGTGWQSSMLAVLAVGLLFAPLTMTPLLEVPLKIEQRLIPLQRLQLQSNSCRVGLACAALWVLPAAPVAVVCAALCQSWMNSRLRRLVASRTDLSAPVDAAVEAEIRRSVRRTFPSALYYCVAGQINVWLLGLFGSAAAVAQVGALGRLAAVFTGVQSIVTLIVVPRFARLPEDRRALVRFYLTSCAVVAAVGLPFCAWAAAYPATLLWVLGGHYAALEHEVLLMVAGGVLGLLATSMTALNMARGYLPPGWVHPVLGISHFLALALLVDVGTVRGVLTLQALLAAFSAVYAFSFFLHYTRRARSAKQ